LGEETASSSMAVGMGVRDDVEVGDGVITTGVEARSDVGVDSIDLQADIRSNTPTLIRNDKSLRQCICITFILYKVAVLGKNTSTR
jgi:hypothetical protein